ncbi:MAG TPA: nucleotide exchange factor GrpE [Thermoplasmata archaeon]|jgi:molecular chaperone GrpE|nr:nucleotide exchange factor GrpE [Thermoplasmata archaeon]
MPDEAVEPVPGEARTAAPPTPPEDDWATRYKYLLADFENYRRRAERERESLSRQARAAMVRELLPIVEAFRAAREAVAELPADSPVRRGLDLLDREWATFLRHEGVEPVARAGQPFSPTEQEAVGDTAATAEHPDGSVAEVVQQGYRFFGGLLRPAKVIVARAPAAASASAAEAPP